MKSILVLGVTTLSVALSGVAFAADMPVAAPPPPEVIDPIGAIVTPILAPVGQVVDGVVTPVVAPVVAPAPAPVAPAPVRHRRHHRHHKAM